VGQKRKQRPPADTGGQDQEQAAAPPGGGIENDPLWEEYARTRSTEARDRLIERYMPLVDATAERMAVRLPSSVDVNDLRQAGSVGLIDAIEKFDHTRGIKFETYCARRLSGEMFDDLRRYDWVPRLIRNKIHQLERAREELETELQRQATDEELAEHLDISMEEFDELQRELDVKSMVSLDRKWDDDGENEASHLDVITDTKARSPVDRLQREEIKSLALRGLKANEKAILIMYYYENMTLQEIGAVLDISESRVCQIHQQTLALLRDKFAAREVRTLP
jgi:RNA polymerase sigma factor for flagellar operon FliA